MKNAVRVSLSLALAGAVAAAVPARAGTVDLEVRTGDKASGTLRPATDTECFSCDLAANSTISTA